MTDESRTATPPPDWQARAIAFAEAYAEALHDLSAALLPSMMRLSTQFARVRRAYLRDLRRVYRRRYHQRPPLTRKGA